MTYSKETCSHQEGKLAVTVENRVFDGILNLHMLSTVGGPMGKAQKSLCKESSIYRPPWNCHLTVVVGFGCPNHPRSHVAGGCLPLVGSPKANRSW